MPLPPETLPAASSHGAPAPGGGEALIRLAQVTRRFGDFTAVDHVSLDIARGEVFGLIGHNGAGKSTLFKMMLGLLAPSEGQIHIAGQSVAGASSREVRRRLGYLPENVALWDNLSGLETLRFFARLKQIDPRECQPLLERVGLGHAGTRAVRAYSKGMRQRLGFAQALLGTPQVLFLDEPTTGLDPSAIHFFWDTLAELRAQGLTIVLTSHILAELQNRVDRVAVMTNGRVQALGSIEELRAGFDLPVTVRARLALPATAGTEALHALLPPALSDIVFHTEDDGTVLCRVARGRKLDLLRALLGESGPVRDIQVQEPSLEDMFFSRTSPARSRPGHTDSSRETQP